MANVKDGDLILAGNVFINNDEEVPSKKELKMWQPNMSVNIGDRVIIPGKPGVILVCKTAGVTGTEVPNI